MKEFNIIVAMTKKGGIGYKNKLPWKYCKTDMKYFQSVTQYVPIYLNLQNCVIMGSRTFESLPNKSKPLPNRINIIVTKNGNKLQKKYPNIITCSSFIKAIDIIQKIPHFKTWIIGGAQIYKQALKHYLLDKIYYNIIDSDVVCDTFLKMPKMSILSTQKKENVVINIGEINDNEIQYTRLITEVLQEGVQKIGRNGKVLTIFSRDIRLDVSTQFPILTLKKMFWKGIVEELLFFIKGETNSKVLEDKKIYIWKLNTTKQFIKNQNLNYNEGDMGPMYGYQWRHYGYLYDTCNTNYENKGIDQLKEIIENIKNNPNSRRHLMTCFDPKSVHKGVLFPCHSIILQFFVEENKYLSVKMYQRSADLFLGVPFNIASTSLLLYIISSICNLKPKHVFISFGDVHIYKEHLDAVDIFLQNQQHTAPKLQMPVIHSIDDIKTLSYKDFVLIDYKHEKSIKASMIP